MAILFNKLKQWQLALRERSDAPTERTRREEQALLDQLCETLYREDLKQGGWGAEVGSVGPEVYRREAAWILREVALGNAQQGPPTP
jgi:hypothetical protein